MATVMDVGLLQYLSPIFMFLFILAIVYAVLDKFEFFGKNKNIKMIIAFCVGVLFLFSETARRFLTLTTPWFVVLLIIVLFILVILMFIGLSSSSLANAAKDPAVYWVIIVLSILLLCIAFVYVLGEKSSPYTEDNIYQEEAGKKTRISEGIGSLIHPKVLGALFLLIIATFAARFVSASVT